jgi:dTDP-4-amino-4,6-dideoxygalactose transaminase
LLGERELAAALAAAPGPVRAVLPVHLAGQAVDMPALARAAAKHNLVVIEDACHALGTTYRDGGETITVGSCRHSAMAIFSFHPVKAIAMGEGGAITTNDPALYKKLLQLRNHGMTREAKDFRNADLAFGADGSANPWYYEMPDIGFNYRASDIHCALALSQLGKLDGFIARRQALAESYDRRLAPLAPLVLPPKRVPDCLPAWHLYAARIDFSESGVAREDLMRRLKAAGIGTQVHYIPVHLQPYYQGRSGPLQMPGSMAYYRSTLSLPLFPTMTDDDVARVVAALAHCLSAS